MYRWNANNSWAYKVEHVHANANNMECCSNCHLNDYVTRLLKKQCHVKLFALRVSFLLVSDHWAISFGWPNITLSILSVSIYTLSCQMSSVIIVIGLGNWNSPITALPNKNRTDGKNAVWLFQLPGQRKRAERFQEFPELLQWQVRPPKSEKVEVRRIACLFICHVSECRWITGIVDRV